MCIRDRHWVTSTLQLQLTSLDFCRACRSVANLDVTVEFRTPLGLWAARETQTGPSTGCSKAAGTASSRVPAVRAGRLTWKLPLEVLAQAAAVELWKWSKVLRLQGYVHSAGLELVTWPVGLEGLSFGDDFNHPIAGVVWPASLQQLSFSKEFNQPIAGVVWPASLQQLSFGGALGSKFSQSIDGIEWPASLRSVTRAGVVLP